MLEEATKMQPNFLKRPHVSGRGWRSIGGQLLVYWVVGKGGECGGGLWLVHSVVGGRDRLDQGRLDWGLGRREGQEGVPRNWREC